MIKKSRKWLIRNLDKLVGDTAKADYRKTEGDYCKFCDLVPRPRQPISHWFHFLSRKVYRTRWMPENFHASCGTCNTHDYERNKAFIARVVEWYKVTRGTDTWEALNKLWHQAEPVTTVELREHWERLTQ